MRSISSSTHVPDYTVGFMSRPFNCMLLNGLQHPRSRGAAAPLGRVASRVQAGCVWGHRLDSSFVVGAIKVGTSPGEWLEPCLGLRAVQCGNTGAPHLQSWWCHPSVVVAYIVQVFLVAPPVHWGHGVDLCRPMPSQDEAPVWLDFLCPPLQDGGRVVPRDMGSDRCQIVGRCGRARFSVTVTTCGVLHTRRLHIRERLRYISSARGLGGGGSQMCGMSPFQGPCGGAWGSFGGALGLWLGPFAGLLLGWWGGGGRHSS